MSKEDQIKLWCKVRLFELMGGIGDNDAKTVLKELLDFIDNDPFAEPAPQTPELSKVERTGKDCKEEPANEDLEKEILRYNDSLKLDANDSYEWDDIATNVILAARHFAEWQKHRMIEGLKMDKPWIKPEDELPKHCNLVFCALFDVKREAFQYYVGWYNANEKEWFLADFGYTIDVAFWMPIPLLEVSDL